MSIVIDLRSEVKRSADLHLLEGMLGALVGQRCLKVELSYGQELMVHLGDPIAYTNPKLADEAKGSWILGTRASRWTLLLHEPPVLMASNGRQETPPEEVEKQAEPLIGRTVVAAKPEGLSPRGASSGVGLTLVFSDGARLAVLPDDELDKEAPLADWELFTPYNMYLACGPGSVWSYERSDVMASDN